MLPGAHQQESPKCTLCLCWTAKPPTGTPGTGSTQAIQGLQGGRTWGSTRAIPFPHYSSLRHF